MICCDVSACLYWVLLFRYWYLCLSMEVRGAGAGDGGQGARELLLVVAKDEISKFEVLHAGYTYVGYVPSFFVVP